MPSYLVTYDLSGPESRRDYERLYDAIKQISGAYAHLTESSWVVSSSTGPPSDIRDRLRQVMDDNDKLLVVELTGRAAWYGLTDKQSNWIKEEL